MEADEMYIAYDLFIHPSYLEHMIGPTNCLYDTVSFHYTLFANILHSSSKLILQELTLFCNLFSFLQKVLSSTLH